MKDAAFRVFRWFFYSVVLAIFPILISFAWLPKNSSVTTLLSHGDLAVIASALLGLSLGEIIGSEELQPLKWLREVLIIACVLFWTASLLLLSFISGNATQFTQAEEVQYSWYLLLAAVVIGIASFAATVSRTSGEG
jgi:hypothetical protein